MAREEGNNEFGVKLSEYISNVVEYLDKGENGRHEMNVNNLHLLETSNEVKRASKLALNISDTKNIAQDFLDNESLN
jgi:hypothetical protein